MPPTQSQLDNTTRISSWENSTVSDLLSTWLEENTTMPSVETTMSSLEEQKIRKLHEFQIIKAVVLAVVTAIIMFSVCKMVFQLFIRYSGKQDDR
jgi:hypothetical protein